MKIEIYSQSHCPFCRSALQLLESRGLEYTHHDMDGKHTELAEAKRRWGHPTVPIVIIDGELIGGCQELMRLDASGGLAGS
jgi:glutaredoxin